MKKIFLIFTVLVSSYSFTSEKGYSTYETRPYTACSYKDINKTITCVNDYIRLKGYSTLSGIHAVQSSNGVYFFQALIKPGFKH